MRLAVTLLLALGSVASVSAHVMVLPTASRAGGVERYTVIVPTEGKSATVRLEVRLPMGIEVVAIESKPGWQGANRPFPVGAATIGWTGGGRPPGGGVRFGFFGVDSAAPRAPPLGAAAVGGGRTRR